MQIAYEYSYTGDGIRHMKMDHLANKEYRYGCSIDCGGMPLRVYSRDLGSEDPWVSIDNRMSASASLWYGANQRVSYPAGNLVLTGSSATSIDMDYKDSAGLPVAGSLPLCDEESLVPMPCVPADCWMTEEGVMPYSTGDFKIPQFDIGTNHYYTPHGVFLPILGSLLKACLTGIAGNVLADILKWLFCFVGQIIRGSGAREASAACGGFPVPTACEIIGNCLGGMATHPLVKKFFPKLPEAIGEIIGGAAGEGLCKGLTSPVKKKPCPESPRSPQPVTVIITPENPHRISPVAPLP